MNTREFYFLEDVKIVIMKSSIDMDNSIATLSLFFAMVARLV